MSLFFVVQKVKAVDLVVFSFDRPMQLYALLESVEKYITGLSSVSIVYRSSNTDMHKAYKKVKKRFCSVNFIEQSSKNPRGDFKEKTMQAVFNGESEYVLFAVDDIIVKDYVDLAECVEYMKKTHAHGFYLRLGINIDYCYMAGCKQNVPDLLALDDRCYAWRFNTASHDWGYPNTVDMTLYSKQEVAPVLHEILFSSPNYFEGNWANAATRYGDMAKIGLCYAVSKIVNLPLNRVQADCPNKHLNAFTTKELLHKFNSGFKIDINALDQIVNNSPHMEYIPTFVKC